MTTGRQWLACAALIASASLGSCKSQKANKNYGPGVTDKEVKLGQTMPYSGPASAYGTIGKAEAAYFKMINEKGGVGGRQINLVSLDDGYSPPRTVEQIRKLVEQEQVLLIFQSLGTPANTAIQKYLNDKKVPQLFVATGATKWGTFETYPWTMGWQPSYQVESKIYARYILEHHPSAKVGVLYQNDDYGKDYLHGFKEGLGEKAGEMIVAEVSYEVTDPTVDSQIVTLKGSGADTFFNIATPKFAAQAIRKAYDTGWKPLHLLNNVSSSVSAVLEPAGLAKSAGIITTVYLKDPTDPQYEHDKARLEWLEWMKQYYPEGNIADGFNVYGYSAAQTLVKVLAQCGEELTRENVMRQAANLKDLQLPMALPGVLINTSPTDYFPFQSMRLQRFDGEKYIPFGEILGD